MSDWKPPDPKRGVFLVASVTAVFLVASASVLAVIWAHGHPNQPDVMLINIVGLVLGLLACAGLMLVFRLKVIKMIPVVALAVVVILFYFLTR